MSELDVDGLIRLKGTNVWLQIDNKDAYPVDQNGNPVNVQAVSGGVAPGQGGGKKRGRSTPNLEGKKNQPVGDIMRTTIAGRRGQTHFRNKLLKEYQRCLVTGCPVQDVLEAAHIKEYANQGSYDLTNGLLLRADIHTMFDLNLIGFEPIEGGYMIRLHPNADKPPYSQYNNKAHSWPKLDPEAMGTRYTQFKNA